MTAADADVYTVEAEYISTVQGEEGLIASIATFAAEQMKKSGRFNLADVLTLKLKVRPARNKAKPKVKAVTKEPCVVKAKPASLKRSQHIIKLK